MAILDRFMAYAADFEQTLVDDDWSRLEPYFAEDAVYRVEAGPFSCELTGQSAIFAGMKKSLDGFDRKFAARAPALSDGPDVEGDGIRMGWTVTYQQEGWPPFMLRGRSRARLHDGRIVELVDSFDPSASEDMAAWTRETGVQLDPSYV